MKNNKSKIKCKINNKVIIFIVFVILVILIWLLFFNYDYEFKIDNKSYLSGVSYFDVTNSDMEMDNYGIIGNNDDFSRLSNNYSLVLDENLDFSNNNYIYYVLSVDSCNEKIIGVRNIEINNGNVVVTFGVKRSCDVCSLSKYIYFIPIGKDVKVNNVKLDYDVISHKVCDNNVAYKPILYLYPKEDVRVNVRVNNVNLLRTTYPKYNNGWSVNVLENGSIYDDSGKYYYALYWDEININNVDFNTGFYVESENAIDFLESKLSIIGLNDRERNEFIMYWLSKLEDNGKSLVYFELTDEREKYNKLYINPIPDSLLRVNMHIKKVSKRVNIKEQKLDSFSRRGFTVVEWGGTIHKN